MMRIMTQTESFQRLKHISAVAGAYHHSEETRKLVLGFANLMKHFIQWKKKLIHFVDLKC
jgi:hypothetical protein